MITGRFTTVYCIGRIKEYHGKELIQVLDNNGVYQDSPDNVVRCTKGCPVLTYWNAEDARKVADNEGCDAVFQATYDCTTMRLDLN